MQPCYVKLLRSNEPRAAFTIEELERIVAACLATPGDVAGCPAKDWWLAFLFTVINTQLPALTVLALPREALDLGRAEGFAAALRAGGMLYWVHDRTAQALAKLIVETDGPRLFPWRRKLAVDMLLYHFNKILRRAGVAKQPGSAFDRLRLTVEHEGSGILDRLVARADRIERERLAIAQREAEVPRNFRYERRRLG